MREGQRALGLPGAVVEGRDIGSVVFPDAPVKLFLTAEPDKRGERRAEQRGVADPDEVEEALLRRDTKDAKVNPFEPAADAVVLDTSDRTIDDTLARRDRHRARPVAGAVRMTTRLPKVAVIGRQNVGKSTLVNRLFGRRETISDEMPGVTRDRVEVETTWRDRRFALDRHRWLHARDARHRIARRATRRTAPPRRPT